MFGRKAEGVVRVGSRQTRGAISILADRPGGVEIKLRAAGGLAAGAAWGKEAGAVSCKNYSVAYRVCTPAPADV